MIGAIHPSEPIWANGRPTKPADLKAGDEANAFERGRGRMAVVKKVDRGSGRGTVWLHGSSGAALRCLHDERVAIYANGRQTFRMASSVRPGDFLCRLVDGHVTVDPVVAIRTVVESVPAIYLELPAVSLLSEEGFLCRPA